MKILIVEDDQISQKLLVKFLEHLGSCDTVENGKEAVSTFESAFQQGEPYELVCLDIMMPEMDGHSVLKAIRTFEEEHDIPSLSGAKIIMTSALGDAKNVLSAFRAGCEAYIEKPIDSQKLLAEIKKLGLLPQ